MSDSIARLVFNIDATQAGTATKELERMAVMVGRAEKSVLSFEERTARTKAEMAQLAATTATASRQLETVVTGAAGSAVAGFARMSAASAASRTAITATMTAIGGSAAEFAAMLVPGGLLVGAVTAGTHAIVSLFTSARTELQRTSEEFAKQLESMRSRADALSLTRTAFGVEQQLKPLRDRLARAQQSDFGGLTVGEGLNARRTLPAQIAALESQMRAIMDATLNPAAQYSPSAVFPESVITAKGPGYAPPRSRTRGVRSAPSLSPSDDYSLTSNFEKSLAALADPIGNFTSGKGGSSLTAAFDGKSDLATVIGAGRAAAAQAQALTESLADGMQRTLASAFSGLFSKGLGSAADFARGLRDLVVNAFSEILASRAAAALFGSGGLGAMASGGGALGALGMGKVANIGKGGAAGFNFGTAALVGMGGLSIGSILGQSAGTGVGVLGGAASGAALGTIIPGIGNVAGAIIGGLAGAVGGLFGGAARKKAKEAEANAIAAAKAAYAAEQANEIDASARAYLAPAGFSANAYRFGAGRPATTITGNTFVIQVPDGTTDRQAQSILQKFEDMVRAQGLPAGSLPRTTN